MPDLSCMPRLGTLSTNFVSGSPKTRKSPRLGSHIRIPWEEPDLCTGLDIYQDEGCEMPIVAVVGIAKTGEQEVLAFRVGDREHEQTGKTCSKVSKRGVKAIDLWISDGNQAMLNAITKHFPESACQRWSFTRWTMCSRMCPPSSKNSSSRN